MNRRGMMLVVGLFIVFGCKHVDRSLTKKGEIKQEWGSLDDEKFIRVRGIGAAPTEAKDATQARGMARNSGLVAARYELLGRLKGLKLEGGLTVSQLIQTDAAIQERADAVIRGAEEVSVEWTGDGGAVVVLQVPRSAVESLGRTR
mgnify:CR=1 FL=1